MLSNNNKEISPERKKTWDLGTVNWIPKQKDDSEIVGLERNLSKKEEENGWVRREVSEEVGDSTD